MLNFLSRLRRKSDDTLVEETQRQSFERVIKELNAAIDALPEKPMVSVDPATGHVTFAMPEQFPDEALALPKPDPEPAESAEETATDTPAADGSTNKPGA